MRAEDDSPIESALLEAELARPLEPELLHALPVVEPPAGFVDRVLPQKERVERGSRRPAIWLSAVVSLAAAFALVVWAATPKVTSGSLQARARESIALGERAVAVAEAGADLHWLVRRGDDPRAYKDIFPSYDSAVEDGLRDELVPAARRGTVRRYFSAIRPEDTSEASNRKTEQP